MERRIVRGKASERGFTLAALMVILAVMMIFIAYTVPKQWSTILQRERDYQTIFIMRQYARAIMEFQKQHGGAMPTSVQQLRDARQPRVLRWKDDPVDPLTGQMDWLVVPASAVPAGGGRPGLTPGGTQPGFTGGTNGGTGGTPGGTGGTPGGTGGTTSSTSGTTSTTGTGAPATPTIQGFPMKDYAGGPFVGIRSPKTGKSYVVLNGADTYDQWLFTTNDLNQKIQLRQQANALVLGVQGR